MSRPAPEGVCECISDGQDGFVCDHCCEMSHWAHEELYGHEDGSPLDRCEEEEEWPFYGD